MLVSEIDQVTGVLLKDWPGQAKRIKLVESDNAVVAEITVGALTQRLSMEPILAKDVPWLVSCLASHMVDAFEAGARAQRKDTAEMLRPFFRLLRQMDIITYDGKINI